MKYPLLTISIVVIALSAAACGGAANTTPSAVPTAAHSAVPTAAAATATPHATPAATTTPAPSRTPRPTRTPAPTIGEPADDGARIVAVESPTTLVHRVLVGESWLPDSSPVPTTRAKDLTVNSPAVGIVHVRLLLPSKFDAQPSTTWPVLYLLHGGGGTYRDWSEIFDVEALTAPTDLLVVMPDGDSSWYSDWWNGGNGGRPMWETFHLVELPQLIERNWHAGDHRAIAGMSMGGYGAMEYASRQPGMFLFAGSYSGPVDPLNDGAWLRQFVDRNVWGDPSAQVDVWQAHDPLVNAEALRGTTLFVAYGNGEVGTLDNGQPSPWDPTGEVERAIGIQGAAFVDRLGQLNIPVTVYDYGNGTHFEPYFQRDLHRSFPLILEALGL